MERLQAGPINPCFYGENLDVGCLEQGLANVEGLSLTAAEEEAFFSELCLEERMPFLQMLQSSVESPSLMPLKDSGFQTLLKLQNLKKPWELVNGCMHGMGTQVQALEQIESCITHDPEIKDLQYQMNINSAENCCREGNSGFKQTQLGKSVGVTRERRKRKRTRPIKNKEEVESQRMTHIAVERNRRRQMNDHLNVLRSLMPTSYIQRGDQASIVGGAIDFVKELEQLLQSLEAKRKIAEGISYGGEHSSSVGSSCSTSSSSAIAMASNGFLMSLSQHRIGSEEQESNVRERRMLGEVVSAENKSEAADVEVTVIQTHVNLKIHCERRAGQLLKAIVALEDLRLSVLHLNITTSQATVLYCFNLKIEDECELRSADEIAAAVHQIFSIINGM